MKHYKIPMNYKTSGKFFRGMFEKRNGVDAVVLGIIGYLLAQLLPVENEARLSANVLFVGLFGAFGLVGIQGIPVSVYLFDMFRWLKRHEKPFIYNTHGGVYTHSAADVMLNTPQLQDTLADAIDRVKQAMSAKKIDYVEGETFQFAEDPELAVLRAAEEEDEEDTAAQETKAEEPTKPKRKPVPGELDVDNIIDNIVLNDTPEGGE